MTEKLWCVYKHTNKTNGMSYIGRCRWPDYEGRWNHGNGYKNAPSFWPEIERFGWDGFSHEILYSGLNFSEANSIERELIENFQTNVPGRGYNVCAGGEGFTAHHTEKTRHKISETLKRHERTEAHKKHLSESKAGTNHPAAKKVYQLSKSGELIRAWDYMSEACKSLGIPKMNVSACCHGKRPTAGGYRWTYVWR